MTLRDTIAKTLEAKDEKSVGFTKKFLIYTRSAGGYYFLGKNGAVRVGRTVTTSIPLNEPARRALLRGA